MHKGPGSPLRRISRAERRYDQSRASLKIPAGSPISKVFLCASGEKKTKHSADVSRPTGSHSSPPSRGKYSLASVLIVFFFVSVLSQSLRWEEELGTEAVWRHEWIPDQSLRSGGTLPLSHKVQRGSTLGSRSQTLACSQGAEMNRSPAASPSPNKHLIQPHPARSVSWRRTVDSHYSWPSPLTTQRGET